MKGYVCSIQVLKFEIIAATISDRDDHYSKKLRVIQEWCELEKPLVDKYVEMKACSGALCSLCHNAEVTHICGTCNIEMCETCLNRVHQANVLHLVKEWNLSM